MAKKQEPIRLCEEKTQIIRSFVVLEGDKRPCFFAIDKGGKEHRVYWMCCKSNNRFVEKIKEYGGTGKNEKEIPG